MGLFDLFKKKTGPATGNENQLETALRKSATEAAFRSEFYKRLLSDKLVVLTGQMDLAEGSHMLKENTSVSIVSFEGGKIPVFTSTQRIFDKNIIKEQVPFLEMKGEELFHLTKGATLVLNPYSDYGKELLPGEIENMLNGTLFTTNRKEIVVEKDTQVSIGQPANYPTDMVNALKLLFADKASVKKAYLGWIFDPASGQPPHYMFALDVEGDIKNVTNEAGFTAQQFLKQNEMIDFIQIDTKKGISDYFTKQTQPFYER